MDFDFSTTKTLTDLTFARISAYFEPIPYSTRSSPLTSMLNDTNSSSLNTFSAQSRMA